LAEIYHPDELADFVSSFTPYMSSPHPTSAEQRLSCWECHRSTDLGKKKVPYGGFFDGQVAMMVDGSWHALGGGPDENTLPETFGMIPLSAVARVLGQGQAGLSGPVVVIPTRAVDREAAWRLASWMLAPERLAEAALMNGSLPPTRAAVTDPKLQRSAHVERLVDLLSGELTLGQ
jgi:ABC-type glycerol-3-phosphate transport system substrate-binding protein